MALATPRASLLSFLSTVLPFCLDAFVLNSGSTMEVAHGQVRVAPFVPSLMVVLSLDDQVRTEVEGAMELKSKWGGAAQSEFTGKERYNTQTAKCKTDKDDSDVDNGKGDLLPICGKLSLVHQEPPSSGQDHREPSAEKRAKETEKLTENGDGVCNDPSDDPKQDGESVPAAERAEALLVHDIGLAPDANVNILSGHVSVNDTGNDDGGDGNAVGDLANDGASRTNSGRLDVGTREAIDDDSDDDVKRTSASLQHAQGLGEISGVLHLRNETEVGDVGTEGNKDVGDSYNTSAERGHARRSDGVSVGASRRIDSDANHSNEDGSRDGQARSNGHEGDVLHGSWDAEDHGHNHANNSENNGASSVVGKDVQHDGERQDVSGHDEDQEDDLSGFRNLLEPSSEEEETSIGKVVNSRESDLDLVGDISGVCCEDTEEDNEDATRDEAHAGNDSRKREDTQRDGLSNKEETGIEPC
ncbi:putative amino acid transporter, partial [Aureobasidium melanogenum]